MSSAMTSEADCSRDGMVVMKFFVVMWKKKEKQKKKFWIVLFFNSVVLGIWKIRDWENVWECSSAALTGTISLTN